MKTKYSYIYLYDLTQLQTWLEDQAAKGWYLEKCRFSAIAKFKRQEKRYIRYRMVPLSRATGLEVPEEEKNFYAEAGWEYVETIQGQYDVYSTTDPSAQDLFTDADTMAMALERQAKEIRKSLRDPLIFFGIMTVVPAIFFLFARYKALTLLRMDSIALWLDMPLMFVYLLALIQGCVELALIRRQTARLEQEGLEPYRTYPKGPLAWLRGLLRLRWLTTFVMVWVLCFSIKSCWAEDDALKYVPASEVPGAVYASVEDLFPGGRQISVEALADASDLTDVYTYVRQELVDADGDIYAVHSTYYEVKWQWLAEKAQTQQMEKWREFKEPLETVQVETDRAEEVWIMRWEDYWSIAARDGRRLIFIDVS